MPELGVALVLLLSDKVVGHFIRVAQPFFLCVWARAVVVSLITRLCPERVHGGGGRCTWQKALMAAKRAVSSAKEYLDLLVPSWVQLVHHLSSSSSSS